MYLSYINTHTSFHLHSRAANLMGFVCKSHGNGIGKRNYIIATYGMEAGNGKGSSHQAMYCDAEDPAAKKSKVRGSGGKFRSTWSLPLVVRGNNYACNSRLTHLGVSQWLEYHHMNL